MGTGAHGIHGRPWFQFVLHSGTPVRLEDRRISGNYDDLEPQQDQNDNDDGERETKPRSHSEDKNEEGGFMAEKSKSKKISDDKNANSNSHLDDKDLAS